MTGLKFDTRYKKCMHDTNNVYHVVVFKLQSKTCPIGLIIVHPVVPREVDIHLHPCHF